MVLNSRACPCGGHLGALIYDARGSAAMCGGLGRQLHRVRQQTLGIGRQSVCVKVVYRGLTSCIQVVYNTHVTEAAEEVETPPPLTEGRPSGSERIRHIHSSRLRDMRGCEIFAGPRHRSHGSLMPHRKGAHP